jgi:hypothetical protein
MKFISINAFLSYLIWCFSLAIKCLLINFTYLNTVSLITFALVGLHRLLCEHKKKRTMKLLLISVLSFFIIIDHCQGVSQVVIPNTRAEWAPHCSWDDARIFPGGSLDYQPGRCRNLQCTEDFSIRVTGCPFDMTGLYIWVGEDFSKPYPECCGVKVLR